MEEMESKLGAILNNPDMMQKIMALAQSFSQTGPAKQDSAASKATEPSAPTKQEFPAFPELDISMLQKVSSFARQSNIDNKQQALLQALNPYLSSQRITKLEKAMRAAKMASMASVFFGKTLSNSGR